MAKVICLGEVLVDCISNQQPECGGAPANVACGLVKLGTSAALVGAVGGDRYGQGCLDLLNQVGVDTSGMQIYPEAITRQVLVEINELGDRRFVGFNGDDQANFADRLIEPQLIPEELFTDAEFLVMGTLGLASAITASAMNQALELAEDNFVKVVIDINWRPIFWPDPLAAPPVIKELLLRADYVKFSAEEAQWLFQTSSPRAIAQELDHLEGVIITDGDQPCRYYLGEYSGQIPAYNVPVVETTGAGDAFLAGLLHQLCHNSFGQLRANPEQVRQIMTYATAVGAISTMGVGAITAQPNHEQVQNFLSQRI